MTLTRHRLTPTLLTVFTLTLLLVWPRIGHAQVQPVLSDFVLEQYGAPPQAPTGPLSDDLQAAIRTAFVGTVADVNSSRGAAWGPEQYEALNTIVTANDPRVAWLITDMMRFTWERVLSAELATAAGALLGKEWETNNHWNEITDHLIAWDMPAYPAYLEAKRAIFTGAVSGWDGLFIEGDIDWRMVSWGGVPIDPRPFDKTNVPCRCIPAADNPTVTSAADATWLRDEDIVFGLVVNGEARAYPRRIMEVREMVNDTLGGRDLGIPYCTLCGAAQAYFTDGLPAGIERPVLRTTGLLIRSNKVMYDITSGSVFDTFLGTAVTGPLERANIKLTQAGMITSDWGSWKAAYPNTTVLTEDLALGRDFDFRNGRDSDGPIFPVGDVDPRLPVQEDIIGAITASGTPVAFARGSAFLALQAGQDIVFENVSLKLDAGGIRAVDADGSDIGSHQAFWFAWSQFHPETALWVR